MDKRTNEKQTISYLFPINVDSMIKGEKNKVIKIFLNQLDMKFDKIIQFSRNEPEIVDIKNELRQVFLDSVNGFARFTKGLLKNYASSNEELKS